jgi:hypothetical protein
MPIGHVQDYYTFVGGLHTEGSFFLTPKNCWKEGDNVIPQTDGSLDRRNAIGFEQAYVTRTLAPNAVSSLDSYAYTTHIWKGVGGDGNFDVLVVQVGASLLLLQRTRRHCKCTPFNVYAEHGYLPSSG